MFFKLKSSVLFRNYNSFGYITDNRNFGYKQLGSNEHHLGDKILSESGAAFLNVLNKKPQNIETIIQKLSQLFPDEDIIVLKEDAIEFYYMLEEDGFIVSGETYQKCNTKDKRFSYKRTAPEISSTIPFSKTLNSDKSTQDFLEEYFGGKPQLTNLHIEITSRCNERCVHCYIPHENKVSCIEPHLFNDILRQCRDLNVLHITLSGGEPMLHKDFCTFLRKCREYDFSVNVLSNLTLLNEEILREMKRNPLLGVQVSLYSMDSTVHDGITQAKGSFEKTKNSILKLVENDIPIQISCPILTQNHSSYIQVIEWAESNNIFVGEDYGIIGRYNHTTQNLSCRLSTNEIKDIIISKVAMSPKYLEQIKIEAEKKKNVTHDDFVCSVCHSSICISDNGNVYPCAGWQDNVVGNVKETLIREIWNNSEKVQYLRNLRYLDFPKCIKCPDKEYCTICMVRNANENSDGNPLEVNEFFCSIAKLHNQILTDVK